MKFASATRFYRKYGVPGYPGTPLRTTTACAAFSEESRMKFASATKVYRKSGAAKWRDLLILFCSFHADSEARTLHR